MYKSFKEKTIDVKGYDKFNNKYNTFNECCECDIIFLCLPTKFDETINMYNKDSIHEVYNDLSLKNIKVLLL
jgi:hypothetical protein